MKGPPRHVPRHKGLIQGLAADPFDPRFHTNDRWREHTLLGLLLEAWTRARKHPEEMTPNMSTVVATIELCLRATCSDAINEVERHLCTGLPE